MSENGSGSQGSSMWSTLLAILGAILALVYLSNPTVGVFEFIPDNIPGIGNIDEVIATTILLTCLARLGIHITPNVARRPEAPNLLPEKLPPGK